MFRNGGASTGGTSAARTVNSLRNAPVLFGQRSNPVAAPKSANTDPTAPRAALRRNWRRSGRTVRLPWLWRPRRAKKAEAIHPTTKPNSVRRIMNMRESFARPADCRRSALLVVARALALSVALQGPRGLVMFERQLPREV